MLGFSEALRRAFPESYELVLACEIEPACRRVILHHRPGVRLVKDVRGLHCARDEADVITFGSPCQDLSVAGRREGLAGERSGLFFHAVRILEAVRPRWFIFENVPGLLSSNGGRDMGTVLGEFSRLGYWWAYRVLDAQYFGVPQRRRRVFVVGHSGDGAGPLSVLFEPESVCGDPPPSREKGESVTSAITGGLGSGGPDDNQAQAGHLLASGGNNTSGPIDVATACRAKGGSGRQDFESETFIACRNSGRGYWTEDGSAGALGPQARGVHETNLIAHTLRATHDAGEDGTGRGTPIVPVAFHATQDPISGDVAPCMGGTDGSIAIAFEPRCARNGRGMPSEIVNALKSEAGKTGKGDAAPCTIQGMQVRRLTPLECLRLQGFPDSWLDGLGLSDSAKYRMIGNSIALPVVEWIARRIAAYEER